MALSQLKKEKLKELELNKSGVAFVSEKTREKPNPTIIVGLGGLGGKTVNMLKGKFEREIGEAEKTYFRVLDTARKDTDEISKIKSDGKKNANPNANMDETETISLYDPNIKDLIKTEFTAQYIKDWLEPQLIGRVLDNKGAQQTRQIGRVMLCNDVVYPNIRNNLKAIINEAIDQARPINGGNVDVIVIAGISGGTGSGSIIDLPYMIHDIFNEVGFGNYNVAGYIYTPDAQFEVHGIAGNEDTQLNLKTNGYAALKEIDYFMNIEETGANYNLKLGNRAVNSQVNIFKTCTLVSGYSEVGGINTLDVTMGRLTDQLMDMLTDISYNDASGQPVQLANEILNNAPQTLGAWFLNHPSRQDFHRYASYNYQVLGYNSIKIPRNEILAYCVNKIYEKVLEEFMNYKKVNKQMLDKVYSVTATDNIGSVRQLALSLNKNVVQMLVLEDNIKKSQISENNFIGYQLALQMANYYSQNINNAYRGLFVQKLYEALERQIFDIFDHFGPYVALKAIEHKASEPGIGNPDEPFSGIHEQLINLGNAFKEQANKAKNTFNNGGKQKISQAAYEAAKVLSGKKQMTEYKNLCCQLAVITEINAPLYDMIADGLYETASMINDLNSRIFEVYTSVLTEIQKILNNDGQYFSESHKVVQGTRTSYSVDILANGTQKAQKLEKYLDSFISTVSVQELAQNFIDTMRDNREKWLAENDEDDFDVVSEVRTLMDECLINNKMRTDIIEKFIVVAYNPQDLEAEELDAIWSDDSPNSLKTEALTDAAKEIYNILTSGAKTLAQSTGLAFNHFSSQIFIGTLADAPKLSAILSGIIKNNGQRSVTSNAKDKFICTQQYFGLPMYILKGMNDFDSTYIKNKKAGKHMDENKENWGRFPNPYTIDSVAKDIAAKNLVPETIQNYPDYQILVSVKNMVDDGIDNLNSVVLTVDPASQRTHMYLMDIVQEPDKDTFKAALEKALKRKPDLDLIQFMKDNGYVLNQIEVKIGFTDVDLSIRDLSTTSNPIYQNIPVPIADMYKWVRKSMKYIKTLENNNPKFQEIADMKQEIIDAGIEQKAFINNVETFAFALRTGYVKQKTPGNNNVWNYMNGNEPVTVKLTTKKSFDKKYYLYNVYKSFVELDQKRIKQINAQAVKKIENEEEIDFSPIMDHIEEILGDTCLGDKFNWEDINDEAYSLGLAENYMISDLDVEEPDPARDLERFYSLLLTNME